MSRQLTRRDGPIEAALMQPSRLMPATPAGTGSAGTCVACSACGMQALAFRAPARQVSCAAPRAAAAHAACDWEGGAAACGDALLVRAPWHRTQHPLRLYRPPASHQHGLSCGAASGLPGGRPWLVSPPHPLPAAACSPPDWEVRMTKLPGASSASSPAAAPCRAAHALPPGSPPLAGSAPCAPSPAAVAAAVAEPAAGPAWHPRASGRRPGAARHGASPPGLSGASALRVISAATRGSTGREEAGTKPPGRARAAARHALSAGGIACGRACALTTCGSATHVPRRSSHRHPGLPSSAPSPL